MQPQSAPRRMARHHEQEWQFAANDLDATRAWIARQPATRSERRFAQRTTLELRDSYYDTPDWMIFRAGFALRMRHAHGDAGEEHSELTLKSLNAAKNGLADRIEYTEQIASADLSSVLAGTSEIGSRIRELAGNRTLVLLFHARTRRERQQLLEAESELPLAELDLDQTSIESPSGAKRELLRIEVECINAEPGVLAPLIADLCAAAQLTPSHESKFRIGLSTAGLEPRPMTAQQVANPLNANDPFAKARGTIFGRLLSAVLECEPRVRSGNATAVHEMRVALRRLDVLSRTMSSSDTPWITRSRNTIRSLVKALGKVRDCDVQLGFLSDEAGRRDPSDQQAIAPLREKIGQERNAARRALLSQLDSESTRTWIDSWQTELARGANNASDRHTGIVADELIRAQARKLRKRADRLGKHSSPDDYHEVRIRAKRLRYTLDAFADLYETPARDYLHALGRLQDVLGALHDASVRSEQFSAIAVAAPDLPAATTFVMGRIVESDARKLEECRERFPKAYRRVRRRRWRELRAQMKHVASGSK